MGIGKHVSDVHVMSSLEQVERISVLQFRFFFQRGTPEIKWWLRKTVANG
jgi:hypothetical protein